MQAIGRAGRAGKQPGSGISHDKQVIPRKDEYSTVCWRAGVSLGVGEVPFEISKGSGAQ